MYIHKSIDYTINIRGKKEQKKTTNIHNDIQNSRDNQWTHTNTQITYITTRSAI